jgi:hypothetical protein
MVAMANIVLFAFVVWSTFAIVGMNLFQGRFWSCNDPNYPGAPEAPGDPDLPNGACIGNFTIPDPLDPLKNVTIDRVWSNVPYNFDNFGRSILTLFQVTTLGRVHQMSMRIYTNNTYIFIYPSSCYNRCMGGCFL